jgi:hypothetical protein
MWQAVCITRAVRIHSVFLHSCIVRVTFVAVIRKLSCQTVVNYRFILILVLSPWWRVCRTVTYYISRLGSFGVSGNLKKWPVLSEPKNSEDAGYYFYL